MDKTEEATKPDFDVDVLMRALALKNIIAKPNSLQDLIAFVHRWWCRYYKRPYKDPLFDTYTIEEILLEYYENLFLDNPREKEIAWAEIQETIHGDEDEEYLKELMGENYISKEEMAQQFDDSKK